MMKRRLCLLMVMVSVLSLLSFGCGKQKVSDGDSSNKDTLVIAYQDEAESLDCHATSTNQAEKMAANIYASLLKFDDNYTPQPYVAKSWEISDDKLTYTFELRDDVVFHDGHKMTVADVEYSFKRAMDSPFTACYCETFKEVKAVGDNSFQITLKAPYAPLLNVLCEPFLGIVYEDAVKAKGDKFGQEPIGCGPYKVKEWIPGTHILLEAHDKFFGGVAPIKYIKVVSIPDPSTKLISLENGQVDVADSIASNNRQTVIDNDELVLLEAPSAKYAYFGFNNEKELFKNLKLRQAINCAINKEAVIQIAMEGIAEPSTCTLCEKCFGFPSSLKGYEYNVEKAKQLLVESGLKDVKFEVICKDETGKKIAEAIQSDLKAIGIEISVLTLEAGGYYDRFDKCDFEAFYGTWSDSLMDPDPIVGMRYKSTYTGSAGNFIWLKNDKVDQLIDSARTEGDTEKRKAMYEEMLQYVSDQAYEVPLFYFLYNLGANKSVKNIKALPTGIYYYNTWSF